MLLLLVMISFVALESSNGPDPILKQLQMELVEDIVGANPSTGPRALYSSVKNATEEAGIPRIAFGTFRKWFRAIRRKLGIPFLRNMFPQTQVTYMESFVLCDFRAQPRILHKEMRRVFGSKAITKLRVTTWLRQNRSRIIREAWNTLESDLRQVDLSI
jgi:hypothetical protein